MPLGVEELDPVVLGRVVRGGEDDAEILREQGDGRCRQDATEDGCPTRGDDPPDDGFLEVRPGASRVTPDEDTTTPRPPGGGASEPLDELQA